MARPPAAGVPRAIIPAVRIAAAQGVGGPGVKPRHWRTGCGAYFGSVGSRHIRKTEPRPLRTSRRCAQRWQRLSGNGASLIAGVASTIMAVIGIDHVQLAIPPGGEVAARRFYGEVLGLVEVPKPEEMRARGGLWFQAGAVGLHLGLEDGMRPSAKAHPALVTTDLASLRTRLVTAGCEWRDDHDIPGIARGHTRDPFGNRIELIER